MTGDKPAYRRLKIIKASDATNDAPFDPNVVKQWAKNVLVIVSPWPDENSFTKSKEYNDK